MSGASSIWVVLAVPSADSDRSTRAVLWRGTEAEARQACAALIDQQHKITKFAGDWRRANPMSKYENPCPHRWVEGLCAECGLRPGQQDHENVRTRWWRAMVQAFEEACAGMMDPCEWIVEHAADVISFARGSRSSYLRPAASTYKVVEVPEDPSYATGRPPA